MCIGDSLDDLFQHNLSTLKPTGYFSYCTYILVSKTQNEIDKVTKYCVVSGNEHVHEAKDVAWHDVSLSLAPITSAPPTRKELNERNETVSQSENC